jgi:hypothetical protein
MRYIKEYKNLPIKPFSDYKAEVIDSNIYKILENNSDYLMWKRKNVSLRGINPDTTSEIGNGRGAMLGVGLYTTFLSNKSMAKIYGTVYFVVGAIPNNPLVFKTLNEWEIWFQMLVRNYCKENGEELNRSYFNANTSIEKEVMTLGYDGIIIKGREMVNFTPADNITYFKTERELRNYYDVVIAI